MTRMFIELTEEQQKQLKPLFDGVYECNREKVRCVIGAQIFRDGIHAKLIAGDKAEKLCAELGGDVEAASYSARQAFEDGRARDFLNQGVKA